MSAMTAKLNSFFGSWWFIGPIFISVFAVPLIISESHVISRHQVTVAGEYYDVTVMKHDRLAVRSMSGMPAELHQSEGHLLAWTTLFPPGARGRPPMLVDRPATTSEVEIWNRFH